MAKNVSGTNRWSAGTLGPPSGLSASRPCAAYPAPAFRDVTSAARSLAATVAVPSPASEAGDVLVAFVSTDGTIGNTLSAPAGWTSLGSRTSGYFNTTGAYWRLAPASRPASYTFGWGDSGDAGGVVIVAYSGVDPTTPVAVSAASDDDGYSASAPAVSVTRAPAVHLVAFAIEDMQYPETPPGTTPRALLKFGADYSGDHPIDVPVYEQVRAATGSTGVTVQDWFGYVSKKYVAYSLVLQSPPGPDPTVTLTWTPSADPTVTGYRLVRAGSGTTTTVAGRTTATTRDPTAAVGSGHTYTLASAAAGTWRSTTISTTVGPC